MKTLGIDYGRKKVGLAIADSKIAEPFKVIRGENTEQLLEKIIQIIKADNINMVVVGISEGYMEEEARRFGLELGNQLGKEIMFQDETLTTYDARRLAIEAGLKKTKRKEMEDAYSAALILQAHLDKNKDKLL